MNGKCMKEKEKVDNLLGLSHGICVRMRPRCRSIDRTAPYETGRGLGETEPKRSSIGGETSCATFSIFFVVGVG